MKFKLLPVFVILIFIFIGCDNDDPISNSGNYYYNLITVAEDTTTWHVSYENVHAFGEYYMPSVGLNNTIMLEIYTAQEFNDIQSIPDNLTYGDDITSLGYGGTNEIINYNMINHNASINNPSIVYICYDSDTDVVFKIQFVEYNSGILLFRFNQL